MKGIHKILLIFIANCIKFGLLLHVSDVNYFKDFKAEEGYLVENNLQASEQDVPLEEFFWTGSGDGPSYIKPKEPSGPQYPNTIIRTATILATVYVDGNFESDFDPLCIYDCDKKGDDSGIVESIDHIPPTDRRYWLLTVVAGLFGPQDFPILEEKLAKLYRIAFLRQQAKHLGIANGHNSNANRTLDESDGRKRRSVDDDIVITPTRTFNSSEMITTRRFEINRQVYERQVIRMKRQRITVKRESPPDEPSKTQRLPYDFISKSDGNKKSRKLKSNQNFMQKVSVMIHNVLHGDDEKDSLAGGDTNRLDVDKLMANQSEIIYSVIVGNKPVLAITAAEDMRLVTRDEAIKIMENDVVLKAEPYLREPQATPLIPSHMNSNVAYVTENPLLIALTSIALILLILLLITLLMFGRSRRRLQAEAKRQSATQVLVQKINVDDDINTIRSHSLNDVGVDNPAYENETKETIGNQKKEPPVLNFPLPPINRPSSSTSTTSDSSVYYPKRKHKFSSIQDLLDEKNGKAHRDDEDEFYTKVSKSSGKILKKDLKAHKSRNRRKYRLDNNRVGSVEQVEVHSPNSYQSDGDAGYIDDSLLPYHEHNEAFNLNVSHYNTNKLMSDRTFTVIETERKRGGIKHKSKKPETPTEAFNKELLQQHGRVPSADSNSIGSFLSMGSIRSFPKCTVPEPLSRVLEPVSVTHLDHSDADYDTLKNYRMMDSQKSLDLDETDDVERDARTQSDGADPGIVGPVVWEMHKKGLDISTNSLGSPMRDPHATRNRFEGLLEGAMKLYGSSSHSCHSLINHQNEDQLGQMPGAIKAKEIRGKSAATIRLTSRTSGLLSRTDFNPARPMTAEPHQPSQNPIPSIRAWTSSASGSNSMRPLSAGIYHKPELPVQSGEKLTIDRMRAMSASPIIDAIQKELRRINQDEK